jgi:heat shock protein HslJ
MMRTVASVALGVLVGIGTGGPSATAAPAAEPDGRRVISAPSTAVLYGTTWVADLAVVDGEVLVPNPADPAAYLVLTRESRASGSDGCNLFSGSAAVSGRSISFGPLASTKRACPVGNVLAGAFLRALEGAVRYRISAGRLVLNHPDGHVLVLSSQR